MVTRSFRVALLVVGVGLCAGFGILAWRLTQGVRMQKIGGTVIRRPGLRRLPPVAGAAIKKGMKEQASRSNLAPLATVTVSSAEESDKNE